MIDDKRTEEESRTLTAFVSARDPGLSGWGKAIGGSSVAVWACQRRDVETVANWARNRGDLTHVLVTFGELPRRRDVAHVSIYPVRPGHPALGGPC